MKTPILLGQVQRLLYNFLKSKNNTTSSWTNWYLGEESFKKALTVIRSKCDNCGCHLCQEFLEAPSDLDTIPCFVTESFRMKTWVSSTDESSSSDLEMSSVEEGKADDDPNQVFECKHFSFYMESLKVILLLVLLKYCGHQEDDLLAKRPVEKICLLARRIHTIIEGFEFRGRDIFFCGSDLVNLQELEDELQELLLGSKWYDCYRSNGFRLIEEIRSLEDTYTRLIFLRKVQKQKIPFACDDIAPLPLVWNMFDEVDDTTYSEGEGIEISCSS